MERGLDSVIFLAIVGIVLLFFTFFAEKWLDKALERRKNTKINSRRNHYEYKY